MTEITFQFIPTRAGESEISFDEKYRHRVVEKDGGISLVRIGEDERLGFSKIGSVRYTVRTSNIDSLDLKQTFGAAKDTIQKILHIDVSDYTVCLIMSGEDPVQSYIDQKERIEEFGEDEFDHGNPDYSELNNNTIKLSFRQRALVHG